jgi:DNA replication protein DnaC
MVEKELIHQLAEMRVNSLNSDEGDLGSYECPVCHNKGILADLWRDGTVYENNLVCRPCTCNRMRKNIANLKKNGLLEAVKGSDLKNFQTRQPFQREMKSKALAYLEHGNGAWFYIGGQPGCGKSMVCMAIYYRLLNAGMDCYFMNWVSDSKRLRRYANDPEKFDKYCWNLTHAELLYIDDFLKGNSPSEAELSLAFEIINRRYQQNRLTIISSERLLNEIDDLDEATGSRILEKATIEFVLNIQRDSTKNFRKFGNRKDS